MNLKNNLSKVFFGYGVCIFPLLLLVGPLISEIYLISIIFFSIFYIIIKRKNYFFENKYILFFVFFYLSTLFSTLLNFYNFDTSKSGIFFFRHILFALAIWYVLETYRIFEKKVVIFYSIFLLSISIDSLIQYYTGTNILGYKLLNTRVSSFFDDELILGGFIMRMIPIFLVFLIMSDNIKINNINIFYTLIVSLSTLIVFLSGERTSFFLLILFFLSVFIILKYLRKFILFVMFFFILFSSIITTFQNYDQNNPSQRMFLKTYRQILGDGDNTIEHKKKIFNKFYIFSHDHHGHYSLSFKIFKDYPIFGTGVKGFRYLCRNKLYILEKNDGCSTHPHNTYVQILVSNGIIGFLLISTAFIFILREIIKSRNKLNSQKILNKNELSKVVILLAIFINLWPIVPSGNFFNNWISMYFFYPVGFYLFFEHLNEKKVN